MSFVDFQKELFLRWNKVIGSKYSWKLGVCFLLSLAVIFSMVGCEGKKDSFPEKSKTTSAAAFTQKAMSDTSAKTEEEQKDSKKDIVQGKEASLSKEGSYTSLEEVSLYLHRYGNLPSNYITKKEAMNLGWESSKGNLGEVAPGKSIGGDRFGNREGLLPNKKGRIWKECDVGYEGGYRGGERIVFSNDGEIYYSKDHYKNFELLYGTGK